MNKFCVFCLKQYNFHTIVNKVLAFAVFEEQSHGREHSHQLDSARHGGHWNSSHICIVPAMVHMVHSVTVHMHSASHGIHCNSSHIHMFCLVLGNSLDLNHTLISPTIVDSYSRKISKHFVFNCSNVNPATAHGRLIGPRHLPA